MLREALRARLPRFDTADIQPNEVNIQPVEYRADMVVYLRRGRSVVGIVVVEVQRSRNAGKRYSWPVYVAGLRAKKKCPVWLLVVASSEAVARWAAKPIELGGGSFLLPWVLGPSKVPVVTDAALARGNLQLALLSLLTHGKGQNVQQAAQVALAARRALEGLDGEFAAIYSDFVENALSGPARREFRKMDPATYVFKGPTARRLIAKGEKKGLEKGLEKGRIALLTSLLTERFGALSRTVRGQLASSSIEQLDAMGKRVLSAKTLDEVLQYSN
jgi:hypothetical protein